PTASTPTSIDEGKSLEDAILDASDPTNTTFGETAANLRSAGGGLDDLKARMSKAEASMTGAKDTVAQVDQALVEGQDTLAQVQDLAESIQTEVTNFTDRTTSAFVDGTTAVAE